MLELVWKSELMALGDLVAQISVWEPLPPETEWNNPVVRNFMFSDPGLFFLTGQQ